MNKNVYVVGGCVSYANWLEDMGYQIVRNPDSAGLHLFTGGSDIGSHLYGHPNLCTYDNPERDREEVEHFNKYVGKVSFWGTCRGWQLLSALSGAKIIQDISHPGRHFMTDYNGNNLITNSLHHQAVFIPDSLVEGTDYKLLAWAEGLSKNYIYADDYEFPENYKEVEAGFWPKTRILGCQPHPEMMSKDSDFVKWCQDQVKTFLE